MVEHNKPWLDAPNRELPPRCRYDVEPYYLRSARERFAGRSAGRPRLPVIMGIRGIKGASGWDIDLQPPYFILKYNISADA